jgi:hypothetical protein
MFINFRKRQRGYSYFITSVTKLGQDIRREHSGIAAGYITIAENFAASAFFSLTHSLFLQSLEEVPLYSSYISYR